MKKVLVIGNGGSGQRYIRNISEIFNDIEIYVMPTGKNNKISKGKLINSIEEAVKLEPDGVFIATPTSMHLKYAEKFKDISKFIVIDKPMDSELHKCEVFERNFRFSKTSVYINFQRRFIECWTKFKEILDETINNEEFKYGKINIRSNMPTWRKNFPNVYAAQKELGGGAILTECHEIDLINWLFKGIKEVQSSNIIQTTNYGLDVEDAFLATLMVETKHGLKPIHLTVDYINKVPSRKAEFVFENKIYELDEDNNKIVELTTNGIFQYDKDNKDERAHKSFMKRIYTTEILNKTKNEDLPDIKDGLNVNAVIEAIKKSNKTDKSQPINKSVFPIEGSKYIDIIVDRANEEFKDKLIAIYGMGSLGYGGYVEGWSDFDIDIILKDINYEEAKEAFKKGKMIEKEIFNLGFERIDIRTYSIEHLNERKTILTYGQCSRASMLCDSARLAYGKDIRNNVKRPTIKDMNKEALGLLDVMLNRTEKEWKETPWDDIAAFFALNARFLYSKDIGKVAGKKVALEYFIDKYSKEYSNSVLMWTVWALACRNSYDKRYIQDRLHSSAIDALVEAFNKTREILLREEGI